MLRATTKVGWASWGVMHTDGRSHSHLTSLVLVCQAPALVGGKVRDVPAEEPSSYMYMLYVCGWPQHAPRAGGVHRCGVVMMVGEENFRHFYFSEPKSFFFLRVVHFVVGKKNCCW